LTKNDLIDETKIRLVEESNIGALLIGETDIDSEIVVEGIKDDLDNKYKIILDNVQCKGAEYSSQYTPKCIPPFEDDNYPKIPNDINNLTKKKQKELMVKLKIDFQNIVDSYNSSIKKTSTNEGW
jgi:hypothetical protein